MFMKKIVWIFVFFLLISTFFVDFADAGEYSYGSMYAWFRKDDSEWLNSTVHPNLKLGEEFEIKVVITAKTDLAVIFFKLHEFGTPVFEVIDGPAEIDELLVCGRNIKTGDNFTFIWRIRVKPDTEWFNAYGPLEVFTQFNKNDEDSLTASFDVITAYVVNEYWEGYNAIDSTSNQSGRNEAPGFEFLFVLTTVCVIVFLRRRKIISL